MTGFSKTLTFYAENLGVEPTLMFTFNDLSNDSGTLYADLFPVCWKVSTIAATGKHSVELDYHNQLAFIWAQGTEGKVINAGTTVDINVGQETTLTLDAKKATVFTPPQPIPNASLTSNEVQAKNSTPTVQKIAVGTLAPGALAPDPVVYFKAVGVGASASAVFTPVLSLYIGSEYQQTAIISGEIESGPIWTQDLSQIPGDTASYSFTYNAGTGDYAVTEIPSTA